ncbi:MAG: hypothetical protein LBV43_09170 [Prevotella sp.]|jgi:hypothetical protein|nr:hypothetical protein [Prevotella sp.]
MRPKSKNIFELILEQWNVKFTETHVNKLYNENPHRNTLFGLSNMLTDYNINNVAIKTKNVEELRMIKKPFFVNIEGEIFVVKELKNDKVACISDKGSISIPLNDFLNIWDGVVLLPDVNNSSIEPQYKEHRTQELFNIFRKNLSLVVVGIIFFIGIISNGIYNHLELVLLSIVNLIGIYIGYLLIQKQMYIKNDHADKICSMLKKGNCNSVLNSSAAKLMGVIGWSEVGLSYFISNILILMFLPQLISYMVLLNVCALPYSLWSVWYQKIKVKEWCPLCLIVQVLLWITFVVCLISGYIVFPQFTILDILLTGCMYAIPFLVISFIVPKLNDKRHLEYIKEELNDLRLKPEVFSSLLKQQPYYRVDHSTSRIIWGNKNADLLISIITNPHCAPCAMMHKRIEKLLQKAGDSVCIQYIFSSFNEKLESSSRFFSCDLFFREV